MISTKSLLNQFLPNVFVKDVTINSLTKKDTNSKGYLQKENAGFYFVETPGEGPVASELVLSDYSLCNVLIGVKFPETNGLASEFELLLGSDFKEYIKIYVHQITDKETYRLLMNKKSKEDLMSTDYSSGKMTKVYTIDELNNLVSIESIAGGNISESTKDLSFTINNKQNFLAYVTFVVLMLPEDLVQESFVGNVSSDIVILDGVMQTEGLLFRLSQKNGSGVGSFGNIGDIWAGPVHIKNGEFFTGEKDSEESYILDYQIVPNTKYTDNRIKEKLSKSLFNINQAFEKASGLFKNSFNNSDPANYKNKSFISDIFLTQDEEYNHIGYFSIDKRELLKNKSNFSFIFDNFEKVYSKAGVGQKTEALREILDDSKLVGLNVYKNNELVGTVDGDSFIGNKKRVDFYDSTKSKSDKTYRLSIYKDMFFSSDDVGLENYSFKSVNKKLTSAKESFRIKAEYSDPTRQILLKYINRVKAAKKDIAIVKANVETTPNSFNVYTKKLNNNVIQQLKMLTDEKGNSIVNPQLGFIVKVADLFDTTFKVIVYNPEVNFNEIFDYIFTISNVNTITLDKILFLQNFLEELLFTLEKLVETSDSSKSKDKSGAENRYANNKTKIYNDSGKKFATISCEKVVEASNAIYAYDFLGQINKNKTFTGLTEISTTEYITAITKCLSMIAPQGEGLDLKKTFKAKGSTEENLFKEGFSYLNMPPDYNIIDKCFIRPKNDLTIFDNIEQFFTKILKVNNKDFTKNTKKIIVESVQDDLTKILSDQLSTGILTFGETGGNMPQTEGDAEAIKSIKNDKLFNAFSSGGSVGNFAKSKKKESLAPKFNTNRLSFALLAKTLLSNDNSFLLKMSRSNFKPFSDEILGLLELFKGAGSDVSINDINIPNAAPVFVKALSIDDTNGLNYGPLRKEYSYFKNGRLTPVGISNFWFGHQNIVKVEYLAGFEKTNKIDEIIDDSNPYSKDKKVITSKVRSVSKPIWKKITIKDLSFTNETDRMLCRLVRYQSKNYIDETLKSKMELPTFNQYFILSKTGAEVLPELQLNNQNINNINQLNIDNAIVGNVDFG